MPMPTKTGLAALAFALAAFGQAEAQAAKAAYPAMAPVAQYRIASPAAEAATARSAAPPSISGDAEVLVLGASGYEIAAKGKNGFVCLVERSWASDLADPEFWNPKERGPICFNPASARSVLPTYLQRTKWVLAGVPMAEMLTRTKAAIAAKAIKPPEVGSMAYMLSKDSYLGDKAGGHWHPHLMFFVPGVPGAAAWGANLKGSPVMGGDSGVEPGSVFYVIAPNWSDGTPAPMPMPM